MGKKRSNRSSFSLFKFVFIILILLFSTGVVIAFFPGLFFGTAAGLPGPAVEQDQESDPDNFFKRYNTETINIALLGFDGSASRDQQYSIYRPDTILIASINFYSGRVSLVSIPRDSYVKIHGTGIYDKINHSYMYGYYRAAEDEKPHDSGIKTTLLTISDFLGQVPLHGYVVLDMDGAETIVDSIGGIYYDVDVEVRTDYGRGRLLVEEGYQLLDGKKFMNYVRNRAGFQGGERARTERQQKITIAFFDQLRKMENIPKLPRLFLTVRNNLETELNPAQVMALGLFGLRVDFAEIQTAVFSGRGQLSYRDGQNIWYLVIDEEARVETINKIFGVSVGQRSQITLPGPVASEIEEPEPMPTPEEIDRETEDPVHGEPGNDEVDEEEPADEPEEEPEEEPADEPEEEPEEEQDEEPEEEQDEEPDKDPVEEPGEPGETEDH